MTRQDSQRDFVDNLSEYLAQRKGLPVFVGVGLVLASMVLNLFPALREAGGFWGWLVQGNLLLHLGVIISLLGILIGDALSPDAREVLGIGVLGKACSQIAWIDVRASSSGKARVSR